MSFGTLEELRIDELKDLYSAEKQIIRALPTIIKAISSPELQEGLSNHLEETRRQVTRLEKIGEILGKKMTRKTCVGMKCILEEGSEILEDTEKGIVRGAAVISGCQRVERDFAKFLGQKEVAALLDETLVEEKNADKTQTGASNQVNAQAEQEG